MKRELIEKLKNYGQEHLLQHVDTLNNYEFKTLLDEIENIDFSFLDKNIQSIDIENIESIQIAEINNRNEDDMLYSQIGENAIFEGKLALVMLAGGQGSRFGFDGPKGTLNIGEKEDFYLFEALIKNILVVVEKCRKWIPLYIMTSEENNSATVEFFKIHNYFGYDEKSVEFFIQSTLPVMDFDGKILMKSKCEILKAPDGNGGWYNDLKKNGFIDKMKSNGIEWFNVFSVDNPLQNIADTTFLGMTLSNGYDCGAKVVKKAYPEEKMGAIALNNGMPCIIEYYELSENLMYEKDTNGSLKYGFGVTLNYIFSSIYLEKICEQNLPIHKALKKISYVDSNGNNVLPEEPNAYKYEYLVVDMVNMSKFCLPFELVREDEFAPIKNQEGVDSLESAREILRKKGKLR